MAPPAEPVPPECCRKELAESCNMCAEQLTEGVYLANKEVNGAALGFAMHLWLQCLQLVQGDWEPVVTLLLDASNTLQGMRKMLLAGLHQRRRAQGAGRPQARGSGELPWAVREAAACLELLPGSRFWEMAAALLNGQDGARPRWH